MKLLLIVMLFFLTNCGKSKTVLICGDHVCLNKTEAEQYFEENLSIEVKIIDKNKKEFDLVEINLMNDSQKKRVVKIDSKKTTKEKLKTLSKKEIIDIKENIKNKKKKKNISKKLVDKKIRKEKKISEKSREFKESKLSIKNNVYKKKNEVVDICKIIEKCSIDEISKYLLEKGKKKKFPDITIRQ